MHHNPNPNPSSNPPLSHPSSYYSSHHGYYSQNPNIPVPFPHVSPDPSTSVLKPPGVDSYPSAPTQTTPPPAFSYPDAAAVAAAAGYYYDQNLRVWVAAQDAVPQYGGAGSLAGYVGAVSSSVAQNGTEQFAVPQATSAMWPNYVYQLQGNGNSSKSQKKTKVVQSAYCEVCKVDCNSKDVLDLHKLGRKHKKNMEKLHAPAAAAARNVASLSQPIIGPHLEPKKATPSSIQRVKKKKSSPLENLETKRRKIVDGGAAQDAVRVCEICNVVCNSEGVYRYHLAGRKHVTMAKKHMGGA